MTLAARMTSKIADSRYHIAAMLASLSREGEIFSSETGTQIRMRKLAKVSLKLARMQVRAKCLTSNHKNKHKSVPTAAQRYYKKPFFFCL